MARDDDTGGRPRRGRGRGDRHDEGPGDMRGPYGGAGDYGGSFTAGGFTGAGFGGGYYGYDESDTSISGGYGTDYDRPAELGWSQRGVWQGSPWGTPREGAARGPSYAGIGPRRYRRSDARITEEVCERLTWSPDLDASDIEVTVEDGRVRLTGSVDDRYAKRLAEDIVDDVWGVIDVDNELVISRRPAR